MSSTLNISKTLTPDSHWQITATIGSGNLPQDIFIYRNTGTTELGDYIGVCNVDEYQRLQTFLGASLPIFGNRFVKSTSVKILLSALDDPEKVISCIQNGVQAFSTGLANSTPITRIIQIL